MAAHTARRIVSFPGTRSLGVFFRCLYIFFFKGCSSIFFSFFDTITAFSLTLTRNISFRHCFWYTLPPFSSG